MPKTKLKFDDTNKAPVSLVPFLNNGEVEVWFGTDEIAVAAELNPTLETNRNTVLGEKDRLQIANTNLQNQYNALVGTKGATDVEVAQYKAEVEKLKASTVPLEDTEILKAVKTVFPNMSATDLAKQIPQFKEATEKVVKYEKEQQNVKVFKSLGYKNQQAFADIIQLPNMLTGVEGDIFIESVIPTGKTESIEVAHVNIKNAQGVLEKKTWAEYTTTVNPAWKNHLPSLNFVEGQTQEDNNTWLQQGHEKTGEGKSIFDSHIEAKNTQAKNTVNPFMPSKPDPNATTVNQN